MAVAAQRITSAPQSGFASQASTRLGDGVRATSASSSFMPVTATEAQPEVLLRDQGLRNDDWGSWSQGGQQEQPPEQKRDDSGRVYLGTVFFSNADAMTLFHAQFGRDETGVVRAANENFRSLQVRVVGAETYETNARVLVAAYSGQPIRGGTLDHHL